MPIFPDIANPVPPGVLREQLIAKAEIDYFGKLDWFLPPRVKVLIVTDGGGSFDRSASFGLGKMIDIMRSDPWWWVRFDITTAHRSGLSAASKASMKHPDLPIHDGFNFAAPPTGLELNKFDEMWLFGVSAEGLSAISAAEVTAVSGFMNAGGGVFATGDHETLGAAMCGDLPRINKMRQWKNAGPSGTPPPVGGPNRHDTLRAGPSPGFQFDDQSDNAPQPIRVKHYYDPFHWTALVRHWRPHPVLCGINGILDVLPDHMHEGNIVVPSSLNATEFPGGVAPEVIAHATVLAHATPPVDSSISNPTTFGVLGAYDGQRVSVGRIVVDATWHHWFNINLLGFADGDANFEKIKNYYWNVGLWLAPKARQTQLFNAAVYGLPWTHHFLELNSKLPIPYLGFSGIDAIGRRSSKCTATEWVLGQLSDKLKEVAYRRPFPPNPPDPPFEGLEHLREYVMGGVMREVLAAAERGELKHDDVGALVQRGAAHGLAALQEDVGMRAKQMERGLSLLREARAQ
jgi:hypothetical protein